MACAAPAWSYRGCTLKSPMILKLEDIYSLHLGKFMFSVKNNSVPSSFSRSILRTNQVHGYNTRSSNKFIFISAVPTLERFLFFIKVLFSLISWMLPFVMPPSPYMYCNLFWLNKTELNWTELSCNVYHFFYNIIKIENISICRWFSQSFGTLNEWLHAVTCSRVNKSCLSKNCLWSFSFSPS